jgi:hypothetical protein
MYNPFSDLLGFVGYGSAFTLAIGYSKSIKSDLLILLLGFCDPLSALGNSEGKSSFQTRNEILTVE